MRPAVRPRVLCCLFSNCYLVLFDKEKGVVCLCVCVCVFSLLPRDISQPPTFPAYIVTSSRALMIRVGNEAFRSFSLVFLD